MEPYRGASQEELRLLDYDQNRKEATAAPQQPANTGFGQPASTGFGQPASTGFGQQTQPPAFGAKPAGGLFGSSNTGGGFGSTSTGGFGSTNTSSGGLFGQQSQTPTNTFGQQNNTTGGGLFGQPAQQQQPASGGLFNNSNPFGSNNQQQSQTPSTSFSFGAKPATTGFGAGSTGSTGFGAGAGTATNNTFGQTNTSTGFGGFNQNNQQQQQQSQQPATGGLFGGGGFGSTPSQPATGGGLFGQQPQQQQQQQPSTGGLFGNTAAKPGGLFGSTTPAPAATGTSSFSFGQNNNTQQPASGGLFGNTNTTQPSTGGLFGQTQQQPAQQPATGGLFSNSNTSSLFGAKPAAPAATGGGLFGNTQTQPASTGTSLFGNTAQPAQPAQTGTTGGLFGSTTTPQTQPAQTSLFGGGGGLFGKPAQQPQQPSGGLFGSIGQSQPASTSLFGSQPQQTQQPAMGNSLFGQSTAQQPAQAQPTLTASIDQNPYGRNELFNYNGQKLDLSTSVKKPALPPITSSSFRVTPNRSQLNKLRGFSTPLSPAGASTPLSSLSTPNRIGSPSADRYKGLSDTALTPNAFIPRSSIKRLSVTPKPPVASDDQFESVLGKSALKSSPAPATPRAAPSAESPARRSVPADRAPVAGTERAIKKGEYWCKPKLEKLKQLSETELRSIRDFVAGCKGKGEVAFLQPVDLTGLDLDTFLGTIITFNDMECAVYPDDTNKPERGHGLNVPAQISLENVFTLEKGTNRRITDTTDPRYARFLKRIKNIPSTQFVSYSEDGVWTFEVQHFSRYGITHSDDETDEGVEFNERDLEAQEERDDVDVDHDDHDEHDDEEDDDFPPTRGLHESEEASEYTSQEDDVTELTDLTDDAISPPPLLQPTLKQDLEGKRKVAEMQSSFFAQQHYDTKSNERKQLKRQVDFDFAGGKEVNLDERAVKRISFGEERPKVVRLERKYVRTAEAGSGEAEGSEGVQVDAGLALSRSFRCSFGPNGEIVRIGGSGQAEIVTIQPAPEIPSSRAQLLELHLERTAVGLVDGIPTASLDTSIRFRDFARLFDAGDRSHEANIWRLGIALFDEIDLGVDLERVGQIRRKLALIKWLENAVAPLVDKDLLASSGPEKVFALLSGGQVERAVQAAISAGDMRLATLVSQIGGPEVFRQEMQKQLDDWTNVPLGSAYKRIYRLLAGDVDDAGLDWKRAFGLRLWYGNPFEDTISEVLASYNGTPHPPWDVSTDVLYGLIRLYADIGLPLEDVLRSQDCAQSPFDARIQWHLYMLLSRALQKRDFGDRDESLGLLGQEGYSAFADRLTSAYAAQLEQAGEWTWAAFVLTHLETPNRLTALKALLQRHPHPTPSERQFLARLAIPTEWIHEAAAFDADPWTAYPELILAGRFDDAHRILLDKLAVEAIIQDDRALLLRLCSMLKDKPSNWEYGGGVLLDYLQGKAKPQLLLSLFPPSPRSAAAVSDMLSSIVSAPLSAPVSGAVLDNLVAPDRLALLQQTSCGQLERDVAGLVAAA